jgi:hypothetical protein
MTDDMEERLRAALRDRAGIPVAAGDPVAAVQDRMRRRSRRRGIAVGSTAALCVVGIAVGATVLAGNDTSSRPIGPAVSSSHPPTRPSPSPSPSAHLSVTSAEASAPVISLPASPGTTVPTTTLPANASSLTLPSGYDFYGLSADTGQLLADGSAPVPSSAVPTLCAAVSIGGDPLAVRDVSMTNCEDPASVGEQVAAVITEKSDPHSASGVTGTVAVAHHAAATDSYTVGPVVMKYTPASDTAPLAAYGGGSLWIYDLDTTDGPEAIQVSATSGQVEDVVRTPALSRPIIAANSDGLWLGNSIEGGEVGGTLFHVAPGSHVVSTVIPSQSDAVDWMIAGPGHVWVGMRPNNSTLLSLWRFDGPKAIVAFHTPEPTLQAGPNFVVGDEQDGLWLTTLDPVLGATQPIDIHHLDVVRLDADSGKATVEAALPPPLTQLDAASQTAQGQSAFFGGSYFLLQSPSVGGYTSFTQLLRVAPVS